MATRKKGVRKYGQRDERLAGWVGWLGLAAYVAAWDLAPYTETLSTYFAPCAEGQLKGGLRAPHGRKMAIVLWVYITLHLSRLMPVKYDILRSPNSPLVRWQRNATRVGKTL